ncbi:MAG: hypothetical protein RL172_2748 [Bacteroidota bacterium]|jgi:hypothetical protein
MAFLQYSLLLLLNNYLCRNFKKSKYEFFSIPDAGT